MTTGFKHVELYGGAITVNLPAGYGDVSNIREVPDHQEIYLDANGFSSIVIELAERVSDPSTDQAALRYHFEDIVDEQDTSKIWRTDVAQFSKVPPNTPCYTLLATTTPPPVQSGQVARPLTPEFTTVLLTLVRLVEKSTDLLVTINIPQIPGHQEPAPGQEVQYEQGKYGSLVDQGMKLMEEVWKSLEVRDWSLFAEE
ncbi:MAG: hypothetical protein Q9183_000895 [Haloplaca sp. 2 TL-2023]